MIVLPSTPHIRTILGEICTDLEQVERIPKIALRYKVNLYQFYKSVEIWSKECESTVNSLTKTYAQKPDSQLGNTIAVIDTYKQIFDKTARSILKAMESLQPTGTKCEDVIAGIKDDENTMKEQFKEFDRVISMWGDIEEEISLKEEDDLNK